METTRLTHSIRLFFFGAGDGGLVCEYRNLYFHNRLFIESTTNTGNEIPIPKLSSQKNSKNFFEVKKLSPSDLDEIARLTNNYKLIERKHTHVVIERNQPLSHGHIIQDGVLPAFWALSIVNHSNDNDNDNGEAQIVLYDVFDDVTFVEGRLTRPFNNSLGPMPHDGWFRSVTPTNRPIYKDGLEELHCPPTRLCRFDSLVVGYDRMNLIGPHISYTMSGGNYETNETHKPKVLNFDEDVLDERLRVRGGALAKFRDEGSRNLLGGEGDALDDLVNGEIVVTIIQRRASRRVPNAELVKAAIETACVSCAVQIVEVSERSGAGGGWLNILLTNIIIDCADGGHDLAGAGEARPRVDSSAGRGRGGHGHLRLLKKEHGGCCLGKRAGCAYARGRAGGGRRVRVQYRFFPRNCVFDLDEGGRGGAGAARLYAQDSGGEWVQG